MWGGDSTGQFPKIYVDNLVRVRDSIVPVLSGNFLLYEVIAAHFQETSTCPFNWAVFTIMA